jgi:hypothetical protein
MLGVKRIEKMIMQVTGLKTAVPEEEILRGQKSNKTKARKLVLSVEGFEKLCDLFIETVAYQINPHSVKRDSTMQSRSYSV